MTGEPADSVTIEQRDARSVKYGAWMRQQRETRGLSLHGAGAAAGISGSHLGKIERGVVPVPKAETVIRLAKAVDAEPLEACEMAGIQVPANVTDELKLERQRARAVAPAAQAFQAKLSYALADKKLIANAVCQRLMVPNAIDALWVSDGTQCALTIQAYLEYWSTTLNRPYPMDIASNNLHLTCQLITELDYKLQLYIAPGRFYPEHSAALGPDTDSCVSKMAPGRLTIWSATALDFDLGPAAYHSPLRSQKRAILQYEEDRDMHLLLLVQANKLSRDPSELDTSVVSQSDWRNWIENHPERLRVATSLEAPVYRILEATTLEEMQSHPEPPRDASLSIHHAHQLRNSWKLARALKQNFIYVEASD